MNTIHIKHTHLKAAQCNHTDQSLQKSVLFFTEKKFSKMPHARLKMGEKQKNEKHKPLTKYKKHRADKGYIEFSALKKTSTRLAGKCSESPTIFYTNRCG